MKKIFSEPLFHFLLIGMALFLIFEFFDAPDEDQDKAIEITEDQQKTLQGNFARTWQRQPSTVEMEGLIEDKIRDEIAYREALAMGLDREDAYIRRRLRMKFELLMEDISTFNSPTDGELIAYLDENGKSFAIEPQLRFEQIYLNPEKRKNTIDEDASRLLETLNEQGTSIDSTYLGDAIMLPTTIPLSSLSTINRQFGKQFAESLLSLGPGGWQGPIESSYGFHLVRVHELVEGRDPELAEVRDTVERELLAQRRRDIKDETYAKLRERYQVVVE